MTPEQRIGQRARVVTLALSWLGTPYKHQASAKGQGTDCLGLIRGIWRDLLGDEPTTLPAYSPDWSQGDDALLQAAQCYLVAGEEEAVAAGQVLIFRMKPNGPARHCGVYLGEGRFLHAYDGRAVSASWYSRFWQTRLAGQFDYPYAEQGGHA